jgi:integrase/recombinase XerD
MGMLAVNPADPLQRPKAQPTPPRGLSAVEIRRLLGVLPDTPIGRRDRAITLTFALTGRRRSQILRLTAGDIALDGDVPIYAWVKAESAPHASCPGPPSRRSSACSPTGAPASAELPPEASLWRIFGSAFYGRFRRYLEQASLPSSGVHALRHSAAKLRREAGASVEQVSSWLDHSSISTTSTYLRRLEGERDEGWGGMAEAIGV